MFAGISRQDVGIIEWLRKDPDLEVAAEAESVHKFPGPLFGSMAGSENGLRIPSFKQRFLRMHG
jgi:hypothetical protein